MSHNDIVMGNTTPIDDALAVWIASKQDVSQKSSESSTKRSAPDTAPTSEPLTKKKNITGYESQTAGYSG
uniref:WGS project CBMI000000000 data, contig CS3069_c002197 n=1 Tax=Fusarium clavum TaxID=2594811 RepID=A0A090MCI8_9HYPO|nr:unnamed protein product [Fusarium clavum]